MPSFIDQMSNRFGMASCKRTTRPVGSDGNKLAGSDDPASDDDASSYRKKVGACLWASITTRPECAATVATCCRYMANPTKRACALVDRCIRFLTSTPDHGITFRCEKPGTHNFKSSGVTAFSDADWAGCPDSARSTTGVCLMCAGGAFEYYTRMQRAVSLSSTESECIALASCVTEIEFYKSMAHELGFADVSEPWTAHVDNQSAIFSAHNDGVRRTRHINVKYAKVRQAVADNMVKINHVPGGNSTDSEQIADLFTKNVNGPLWDKFSAIVSGTAVSYKQPDAVT